MIYDRMLAARDAARREKDNRTVGVLNTILGECQRKERIEVDGKFVTGDVACVAVLRKLRESVTLVRDLEQKPESKALLTSELAILERFIPQELTREELEVVASEWNEMKDFMAFLKSNYAGRYDGKLASEIFKNKVTQ